MTTEIVRNSYFVLLLAATAIEVCLVFLNLRHLNTHLRVPELFAGWFDQEAYHKTQLYGSASLRFGAVAAVYSSLIIAAFVAFGWFGDLLELLGPAAERASLTAVAYVLLTSLIFTLLEMPLGLYRTFVIEERFGFNRTTLKLWISDAVRGLFIGLLIGAPVIFALLWMIESAGRWWWIHASMLLAVIQLIMLYLYPAFIAPLFNKFTPLPAGELKDALTEMTKRLNFKTAGIYIMDGSRRSLHGNAYFTGIGSKKRIVLFDTLAQKLPVKPAAAVLAHEIGHQKLGHVKISLFLSFLAGMAGFWILSVLLEYEQMYHAFGFEKVTSAAALVIFGFAANPISYLLSPLFNALSRRFEYQADRFAAQAVSGTEDLAKALLQLARDNLTNLNPHPLYSFFHYSHPALGERLRALGCCANNVPAPLPRNPVQPC